MPGFRFVTRFAFASVLVMSVVGQFPGGVLGQASAQDVQGMMPPPPEAAPVVVDVPAASPATTPASATVAPAEARPRANRQRQARNAAKRGSAARVAAATSRARVVLKDDPRPTFTPDTFLATARAAGLYLDIVQAGGWPEVPRALKAGAKGPAVTALRRRLAMEGDLAPDLADEETYDATLVEAVKRFQYRYGLTQNGQVSGATLEQMNVPAQVRYHQLNESARRMAGREFSFGDRYVIVNIPAASAEAIENGRVVRRYVAVVGRPDRASPEVTTKITGVRFNPTWTVPKSIAQKDIIPKIIKDRGTLSKMRLKVLDGQGKEVDPARVNWQRELEEPRFTLRQEPGPGNSLGAIRVNMPNSDAVFMHDTPNKELFGGDFRFNSSGCVRVEGIRELAAWIMRDEGYDKEAVEAAIRERDMQDHQLADPIPVTWVYLTGFVTEDGLVNFRDDIYGLDVPRFASR
jgi:murein L,D-transpeptidase YcbB/YkuD